MNSMDFRFFNYEEGASLLDRFQKTLANKTKFSDVLAADLPGSGFSLLYPQDGSDDHFTGKVKILETLKLI